MHLARPARQFCWTSRLHLASRDVAMSSSSCHCANRWLVYFRMLEHGLCLGLIPSPPPPSPFPLLLPLCHYFYCYYHYHSYCYEYSYSAQMSDGGLRKEAKAVLSCNVRCRGRQVRRVKICTGGIGMGPFDLLCECFFLSFPRGGLRGRQGGWRML